MDPLELKAILRQQPFRPFQMRLSLNIIVEVRHPEMASVDFSIVKLGTEATGDELIVSLSHIVTIEFLPTFRN